MKKSEIRTWPDEQAFREHMARAIAAKQAERAALIRFLDAGWEDGLPNCWPTTAEFQRLDSLSDEIDLLSAYLKETTK